MNPLNCDQIEGQLDLYAAGESDPATVAAVERHLADCPACAGAAAEARRLQSLLDWHGRAPAGLERLRAKIDKEDRQMRQRRRVLPFVARLTAAAALVLLTFGLFNVANEPGRLGQTEEVVAGLVLRDTDAERGGPQLPGRNPDVAEAKFNDQRLLIGEKSLTVTLDRRGSTEEEYRQALKDAARRDALPPPPALNLSLELRNPGAKERTLYLDAEEATLSLDLRGPGVVRLGTRSGGLPPFFPQVARLAPGRRYELPIRRLSEGGAGHAEYLYWTEAGDYTLRMRLRVPYSEPGTVGRAFVTYESRPVHIKVVEKR
jgi:hypothetical protein